MEVVLFINITKFLLKSRVGDRGKVFRTHFENTAVKSPSPCPQILSDLFKTLTYSAH